MNRVVAISGVFFWTMLALIGCEVDDGSYGSDSDNITLTSFAKLR